MYCPTFVCKKIDKQLTFVCPKCKVQHYHGIGEGHRVSHCKCWDSGYIIKLHQSFGELWGTCENILENWKLGKDGAGNSRSDTINKLIEIITQYNQGELL